MLRFLRYVVEILAAFVGVAVICGILLAWRLSSAPLSQDFLTPYIEAGIESIVPKSKVHLKSTLLTWDSSDRTFFLHAQDVSVSDTSDVKIADIPSVDAKISLLGLFFGQLTPQELIIDHPQIKVDRDATGQFIFGGVGVGGASGLSSSESMNDVVRNVAEHLAHAAFMRKLAVTRALFDVHDEKAQKDWAVSIPEISVKRNGLVDFDPSLRYGALSGLITVEVEQKDAEASLDIHYLYDPSIEQHSLTSVFSNVTPALIAGGTPEALGLAAASIADLPLTGRVELTFDKAFALVKAAAQVHGDKGRLVYADFWDAPCPVKNLDVDAKYNRVTRKLTVSTAHIDFNGPVLDVKIDGAPSAQNDKALDFAADISVDHLPMNRYGEIWPKPVLATPRYWLTANLHDGMFDHAEVALKGSVPFGAPTDLSVTEGGGKVLASGASVTYIDGMPPVKGVSAAATFDLNKMDVRLLGGGLGNIRLSPFSLQLTGLADTDQYADIPLQVSGPLPEVLRLLDHPPLGYAKALGLSPESIGGKIAGTVTFHFPLIKALDMKDVDIHATATATDVASTKLIPGVPIDQGNLALDLDPSGFGLKGKVALGKAPFDVVWRENFEQKEGIPLRQAMLKGAVKDDQWNAMGVTAFNGTKGAINVALDITKPAKNKTIFVGALDMAPAALVINMLDWKKPANVPATLNFTAEAVSGKPVTVSSIALRGTHVSAKGSAVLSPDMSQILSFDLAPLVLGRTNASLRFTQDFGENGALRFDAKGASFDVSGLRGGNDPDRNDPRPKEYHIHVDRLYTGENGFVDKAEAVAARDKNGWREIDFHGLADGDTPLSMELTPKPDGHRVFEVSCASFGKAMKGLGFTNAIKGGAFSISGASEKETPRLIKGRIKITNFTVEKLPVLALLLNATSPFGFTDILTDSADFSRFESDFIWEGDTVTLNAAHAAGSAIGINSDGKVDMNSGNADLHGTLVPFSVMNNVLNSIPLIGDLLTGGKNQGVLAVEYKIKEKLDAPKILVNPVSLLTPGFIRNVFFRDGEEEEKK